MNLYVDCGREYRPECLNIDALGDKSPIATGSCDAHKFPLDYSANYVTVKRVFERLDGEGLNQFLADVEQSMEPGGFLKLIVADHNETQYQMGSMGLDPILVFGPHGYHRHMVRYKTKDDIIKTVIPYGFEFLADNQETHEYPCFVLEFQKKKSKSAVEYFDIDAPYNTVLEIGPGNNPSGFASHYLDKEAKFLKGLEGEKLVFDLEEIPSKPLPYKDKQFDFVLASHVFEHLKDPEAVAKEISRVAKRGVIICPSIYKETLFGFEEEDHLWNVSIKHCIDGQWLMFEERNRNNPIYSVMRDKDYQSILCSLFRKGRMDIRERRYLREWFHKNEPSFDVFYEWEDKIKIGIEYER